MKVNLGCGITLLSGYTNVDIVNNEHIKPDLVADITKSLPFDSESLDEILASHVVEHFRIWEVKRVLRDWWRCLKTGAKIIIECPDLDKILDNFKKYPDDEEMHIFALYGCPMFEEPSMEHHWAYTPKTLGKILADVGFINIKQEPAQFHEGEKREFRLVAEKRKVSVIDWKDNMSPVFTTDDVCPSFLQFFKYWDKVHEKYPERKVIAFTIANFAHKENIAESKEFREWFEARKDWVEVAVHGYDHLYPPEAERDDFPELVEKSLEILKPFLPKEYGYRSPGFKFSVRIEPVLKKLGFAYVAYAEHIKFFDGRPYIIPINTHCADKWENPITQVWRSL
jgi:predicted SAM-dependent methyltransferase